MLKIEHAFYLLSSVMIYSLGKWTTDSSFFLLSLFSFCLAFFYLKMRSCYEIGEKRQRKSSYQKGA